MAKKMHVDRGWTTESEPMDGWMDGWMESTARTSPTTQQAYTPCDEQRKIVCRAYVRGHCPLHAYADATARIGSSLSHFIVVVSQKGHGNSRRLC